MSDLGNQVSTFVWIFAKFQSIYENILISFFLETCHHLLGKGTIINHSQGLPKWYCTTNSEEKLSSIKLLKTNHNLVSSLTPKMSWL